MIKSSEFLREMFISNKVGKIHSFIFLLYFILKLYFIWIIKETNIFIRVYLFFSVAAIKTKQEDVFEKHWYPLIAVNISATKKFSSQGYVNESPNTKHSKVKVFDWQTNMPKTICLQICDYLGIINVKSHNHCLTFKF